MKRLVVGIITFNPCIHHLEALQSLLVGDDVTLCVIDNGSDNASEISHIFSRNDSVEIIVNDCNLGIAAAINQLIQKARSQGAEYVMSLDQDSLVAPGYATQMLDSFLTLNKTQSRLGALGAKVFDVRRNVFEPFVTFNLAWQGPDAVALSHNHPYSCADFLITSGTIMSIECLEEIGPMREDLFIDSVDLEWSFRASSRGWQLAGCETMTIFQEIGISVVRVPILNINVRIHHPQRYYYMTRNRFFLYRQPYAKIAWLLRDLPKTVVKFLFLSIVSPLRGEIVKEHVRGFFDSFKL